MIVLGLTGSIGMGKSTTAAMFADEGALVWDADAAVHDLYARGGAAVETVEAAFPGVTGPDGVDRAKLAEVLRKDPDGYARLEAIVHPLVREHRAALMAEALAAGALRRDSGPPDAGRGKTRAGRFRHRDPQGAGPCPRSGARGCG